MRRTLSHVNAQRLGASLFKTAPTPVDTMDLEFLLDRFSEPWVLAGGGLSVGLVFGAFAQQSRFCLRAAAIEFTHGTLGQKLAVWLLTFSAAVLGTQLLIAGDMANLSEARQLASPQSLSGAALGGLMFGAGMVLSRGCASRLLVLSATGNMRALLSGLVFAVVAQASLRGFLSPVRQSLAALYTTADVGGNDLLSFLGASTTIAIVFTCLWLAAGIFVALHSRTHVWRAIVAVGSGLGWVLACVITASISRLACDAIVMEGVWFTVGGADVVVL